MFGETTAEVRGRRAEERRRRMEAELNILKAVGSE